MSSRRGIQTPEAQRYSQAIIEKLLYESLPEISEALEMSLRGALRLAEEHQRKVREGRYKSPKALERGATGVLNEIRGVDRLWRMYERAEQWHEEMEDPLGA